MNNYGALKSLPAQTTIKGQPHQLSYITHQEAGILKRLGGSGENFNGVPAYVRTDDYVPSNTTSYADMNPNVSAGYQQALDSGYTGASGGGGGGNNSNKPQTDASYFNSLGDDEQMALLLENNRIANLEADRINQIKADALAEQALLEERAVKIEKARERVKAARDAEANAITATPLSSTGQVGDVSEELTRLSGDTTETSVNPNSMVFSKDGKVVTSTLDGNTFTNEYLDPEVYTAMTGNKAPTGIELYDRDDVNASDLRMSAPKSNSTFKESLFGLFSDPTGVGTRSYFVPGYGDVMASSPAEAYEKAQFFKDNPELAASYAKGLGAPDFVTGDTDGDGIMDTYSGGADVRVGDAITDPNFDPKLNPTTAKYYDDYFPAQADKFDADGNIYDDEFFAGSGSFAEEGSVNQSMLDTYGGVEDAGGYFDMFDGNWTVGGIEIPFSEAIVDLLKGSSGDTSVGGGGNGGGGNGGGGNDNDPTFKYTDIFKPNMMNFSMISGGGGGGIWDRFRNSYLTKYGLEGESADIEEIKLSYDPVYGVYYYSDGTLVNPEDLEGLNIGEVFQEEVGKTKSGRQKFDAKTGELIETKLYDQTYSTPEGEEITGNQTFAADGIGSDGSYTSDPRIYDPETGTMVSSTQYNLNLSRQAEADYLASLNQGD
jgi:hypothetical protein